MKYTHAYINIHMHTYIQMQVTNVQMVSYSATIMRHVSALLLLSDPTSGMLMDATSYAMDILFHVALFVDISGTRRMKKPLAETWMTNPFQSTGVDR
jgi:hypothetical protein